MFARLRAWLARVRAPATVQRRIAGEPVEGETTLVLYTRRDCPLCTALKAELARARVRPPFRLLEVDIEGDPELVARHGRSVPVLELEGRPLAKGRTSAAEFERRYPRALAEIRAGSLPRAAPGRESPHG